MALDEKVAFVLVKLSHLVVETNRQIYLRQLVDLCAQAVEAERCTIYLVDHERNEIRSRVAQRISLEIRLPLGVGIAGTVAKSGETMNVPDAYADPRFDPEIDQKSGFRTSNTLAVPVWGKGQSVIAVIQVLNKLQGSFERADQMLLERIAESVSAALEQFPAGDW